jgi:hypothetical protein
VILVRRYFGLKHWSERLLPATNPTVAHILQYADRTLVDAGYLADRETVPISSTLVFELKLRQDLSYRMELLTRVLFRARMWETIPLPDSLFALYPLLSPVEWILHRVRQPRPKAGVNASDGA